MGIRFERCWGLFNCTRRGKCVGREKGRKRRSVRGKGKVSPENYSGGVFTLLDEFTHGSLFITPIYAFSSIISTITMIDQNECIKHEIYLASIRELNVFLFLFSTVR